MHYVAYTFFGSEISIGFDSEGKIMKAQKESEMSNGFIAQSISDFSKCPEKKSQSDTMSSPRLPHLHHQSSCPNLQNRLRNRSSSPSSSSGNPVSPLAAKLQNSERKANEGEQRWRRRSYHFGRQSTMQQQAMLARKLTIRNCEGQDYKIGTEY